MQHSTLSGIMDLKKLKIYLIFTGIIIFLLSLPLFFTRGIGVCDDSNFLIIAKWIDHGFKPYNDLIELKPPGIYYTLNVLKHLFGEAWWVSRIFILLVNLILVFILMMFMIKWQGIHTGLLTAIFLYPSLMLFGGYRIHTETFCALFGIVALGLIYAKKTLSLSRALISGIIIGISTLFKQPGIFYLAAYLVFLLVNVLRKRLSLKRGLILSSISSLGFICVWAIALFLLYRNGMLEGFIRCAIIIPLTYQTDPHYLYLMPRFLATPVPLILIAGILSAARYKNWRLQDVFEERELLWLLVFLFSSIPLYKRPYPHYVLSALFAVIILSAKLWFAIIKQALINNNFLFRPRRLKLWQFFATFFIILPVLPSVTGMTYGSYFFIREQRLKIDCLQTYEIGSKIAEFNPNPLDPILSISTSFSPPSRIYYMLERRPFMNYLIMALHDYEKPAKIKEVFEIIEKGIIPIVIVEDLMEAADFKIVPVGELRQLLQKKYRRIPLRFAVDHSRRTKIELYVLDNLRPVKHYFRSKIFPKACLIQNEF